ncbi:MAG: YbaB/EbfC family nucleoid-associated protein [Dermatophilaceae bacterium]
MTLHDDTDLDELADRIRAEVDHLKAVNEAAAAVLVTGRSADGLVAVDMDGFGDVRHISFAPMALERHDARSLSAAVGEALADAARRALAAVTTDPDDPVDADPDDPDDVQGVDDVQAVGSRWGSPTAQTDTMLAAQRAAWLDAPSASQAGRG